MPQAGTPSTGTVFVEGRDLASHPQLARRGIGYLPEVPPLYVDMQVSAYLQFVWELKGLRGGAAMHHRQCRTLAPCMQRR